MLQKLFERIKQIERDLDPQNTGKVFNVLGDILPANQLERMVRDMYANITDEDAIKRRIVEEVDIERFRKITEHTLEGLAKKELNLSAITGKSEEAKERRLVPEVIEDFFLKAAPLTGITLKEVKQNPHIFRLSGKIPRHLWPIGEAQEGQYGKLGKEYKQIVFDKVLLAKDSTVEWVTPGHPLFEAVRVCAFRKVESDMRRGAIFFDLYSKEPFRLDVYSAAVKDGRGNIIHRRIFVAQTDTSGTITIRQPTIFLDLIPSTAQVSPPDGNGLPGRDQVEQSLFGMALSPFLQEINSQRTREIETIERHMEISLNELIIRQNLILSELIEKQQAGETAQPIAASMKSTEDRLDDL